MTCFTLFTRSGSHSGSSHEVWSSTYFVNGVNGALSPARHVSWIKMSFTHFQHSEYEIATVLRQDGVVCPILSKDGVKQPSTSEIRASGAKKDRNMVQQWLGKPVSVDVQNQSEYAQ